MFRLVHSLKWQMRARVSTRSAMNHEPSSAPTPLGRQVQAPHQLLAMDEYLLAPIHRLA